jgi:iron complex outermembrane receptor protein
VPGPLSIAPAPSSSATPTHAYTLVDLEAGARLARGGALHSLTLHSENAADAVYRYATSRIKDFALNPGRNFALPYRVRC